MSGLGWVAWRQQRPILLAAAGIIGAFLIAGATEHFDLWYRDASPSRVLAAFLPAALGVFWGAPLLAREVENATIELLWTQTVSRTRWLAHTLVVVVATTAGVALAVRAILPVIFGHRFPLKYTYPVISLGAVGYALFAVALGVFVGAVLGRVELAMGVTLAGYALVRVGLGAIEERLLPIHRIALSPEQAEHFNSTVVTHLWQYRRSDVLITYQPASQLAKLQWLELGLFCALTAALLAATFLVVARRGTRT